MYDVERTINGTYGEVWVDDYYMAEVTALEAKVTLDKTEVNQTGTLRKGYKVTGMDCKGTIKLNKVTSYFIEKMSEVIKMGKSLKATIISNLEDPDAFGAEKVKLIGCTFDELTLANWEVKKIGEESMPFTFEDWEVIDTISAA